MVLSAIALWCSCSKRGDPQAEFERTLQLFRSGNIAKASVEADHGYAKFHSVDSEWAWKFRILQANALIWQGTPHPALSLLSSEPSPPVVGDLAVQRYRIEAAAYLSLNLLPEAEQKIHAAEQLCTNTDSAACANVLLERGSLEMVHGRLTDAEASFARALLLARMRIDRFLEAGALLALSHCGIQQEHFDQAVDWAQASYRLALESGFQDIAQNALGNLGWTYYKLGEPEKAERFFADAEVQATKLGDATDQVKWLTTVGYVYLDAGNFAKAEQSYRQSLDLAKNTNQQDVIDALVSLALVSERTGRLEQARDYADRTIALVPKDGDRLDVLYPMLVKGHVAARIHDREQAEKIYREIELDPKSHIFLKWESEHSLAQLYEDENQTDTAEREYRAALNSFEGARCALHEDTSLPFPANAAGIYDDYIRFLVKRGKDNEALQIAEYQRGRTLAEGLGVLKKCTGFKPDDPKAQATARKVGGTILFYWLGEKQSYLWTITQQKTTISTLPPKSAIEPVAQRYRRALADQQEFLPQTTDDGLALYHNLVEPAANQLPRQGRVFIIPDGSLNTLNFETLLVPGSTPHYWIEDVTITDASSLRLLAASRTSPKHTDNVLLFGNAVSANHDYPELRKAAAEMESIERHFEPKQQQVFAREQATPAAYLANTTEQYSYIHFVAHGTASRMSPLDSAIVLSRSSAQEDSFKLYARDIIHHPLKAQLVTISTCYGAGARAYSGEGLVGLSWAFLRAGAHNVIGALWEVSDVSTPQLMDQLYSELEKGKTPDTALRSAKLTLLKSSSYSKPFYWAPFQLYTGS